MKSEIRNPKSETSPKGQIQNPKDEGDALPWSLELRHSDLLRNSGFGIRAFSLIEVLVVVSIIIILVGLALAGINLAYQRGEESAARALLGTLAGVEKEFYAQTGQSVPASANGDLNIDDGFLVIVQENSSVATEFLKRIPSQYRASGDLTYGGTTKTYDIGTVKDPWDILIRYNTGSGDSGATTADDGTYGLPKQTYPFFASAGADAKWGRWNHTTNAPYETNAQKNLSEQTSDTTPDAKDNVFSFEVK